ncbi:MAG: sulfonate transport system ATP-binding protein [Archaeoglobaceae archaeon]|nr:sulfonate transport system ATP-binding protein [Archaeoglobaceae archaeon]MDK2877224.1 sulfonate transport system ATP-binding protein [Archaeoglobaceae archaeon]
MKQGVVIARALACDPEILLMDEPFAALDAQTRMFLQEELVRIWEKTKKTILHATHNIEEAVYLSNRIVVLSQRPSKIKKIFEVNLPRPRNRFSSDFVKLAAEIFDLLRG